MLGVVILSHVLASRGVSVTYEGIDRATNEIKEITVSVQSLLTPDGIRYIFESLITNFTSFAALGTVLVAMLGVGVAEGTGLIGTALRRLVLKTPKSLVTMVVVFAGVMSSIASDAWLRCSCTIRCSNIYELWKTSTSRYIAAAFAGVSGGFSANLFPGPVDALLACMTTEGAHMFDPSYSASPVGNWYFIMASTVVITLIGTLVTEKIVEPRLGKYRGELIAGDEDAMKPLDEKEKKED